MLRQLLMDSASTEGSGFLMDIVRHYVSEFWFWAQELHHSYRHGTMVDIMNCERSRVEFTAIVPLHAE